MRHLALSVLFVSIFLKAAVAGDFWFYEWIDPPTPSKVIKKTSEGGDRENGNIMARTPLREGDKRWVVTSFDHTPYQGQIRALRLLNSVNRVSVLFSRRPAPVLAEEYLELARHWRENNIEGQFKFIDSLPNQAETAILKPLCELGVRISFITSYFPGDDEIANLNSFGECAKVDFALKRYFRYEDVEIIQQLKNVPLSLTNNYFPVDSHVNNLNLIGASFELRILETVPSADQLAMLTQIKKLSGVFIDMDAFPSAEQYGVFEKLDPQIARKLTLRWAFGGPRDLEFTTWSRLKPARLQIVGEALATSGTEEKLRALSANQTEVIVEMFPLTEHTLIND